MLDEDEEVDSRTYLMRLAEGLLDSRIQNYCGEDIEPEEWDTSAIKRDVGVLFGIGAEQLDEIDLADRNPEEMRDALWTLAEEEYAGKEASIDGAVLRRVERDVMLQVVDSQWKDHLYGLDHLKEGIGLRGYGQRNPLVEYKRESFAMFEAMRERIEDDIVRYLWRLRPVGSGDAERRAARSPAIRQATPTAFNDPTGLARALRGGLRRAAGGAATGPHRRGRRRGPDGTARDAEGRPERAVPLRERQEVQEVPRSMTDECQDRRRDDRRAGGGRFPDCPDLR